MRNYKTNFTEVDNILFEPKREKSKENKCFYTTVEALITFHDIACHLDCIFFLPLFAALFLISLFCAPTSLLSMCVRLCVCFFQHVFQILLFSLFTLSLSM